MPTILVFIPFSRHIFRQMLAGVHRFYGGATPIGDIAQACGYGTEAALRIAFRKRFGQPMRVWRANRSTPSRTC